MGRNKQIAKRDQEFKFRVFSLEKQVIEQMAQDAGMTVSAYLRHSAMNHQIKQRLSQEEIEILQMLRAYRQSFKLLIKGMKEGKPEINVAFEQLISRIDQQLKKLQ